MYVQSICSTTTMRKCSKGLRPRPSISTMSLSDALARAEKNQLVARNVGRLVEPPRQTRKEMRTLTIGQVTTKLLPALQGQRLYAAFLALFMMGLRRGELLGLRWQDIDWKVGVLHVRQTLVRVRNHEIDRP